MESSQRKKPKQRSRFTDEYGLVLERLIAARQAAGLFQSDLAERLGKVQSHISLIESREREISFVEIFWWCQATNLNFSDLARDFEQDVEKLKLRNEK